MLWESSKMEQRYDAVLGVIRDGFTVTEVAHKFGVSRQSVHTWLQRYEEGGLEALKERSSKPTTAPAQIEGRIEARILELRRHHPSWGAVHLQYQLKREGVTPLPSAAEPRLGQGEHLCERTLGVVGELGRALLGHMCLAYARVR